MGRGGRSPTEEINLHAHRSRRIEAVVAAIAGRDQDLARPENQIRPGAGPGRQRPINARTQIERPGDRESARCGDGAGTIQQRWPTSRHRPGEPLTRWPRLRLTGWPVVSVAVVLMRVPPSPVVRLWSFRSMPPGS